MPIETPDYDFQPKLFTLMEEDVELISVDEARLRNETARKALGARDTLPGWYEEYLNLVNGGWPWRVAAYIAWAAAPRAGRWPETQERLALDVLGLSSDRQIIKWRKNNPAITSLISTLQAAPMLKHRADVIDALIQAAKDPDYKSHQDRKLFLEITGDYIPASKWLQEIQTSTGDALKNKSSAELEKYAGKADGETSEPG